MQEDEVISILQNDLKFSDNSLSKLKIYVKELLIANKNYNLISKSTENTVWHRHVLDSAQLVKFINFNEQSLCDLGSGAGFPGIVLGIFNKNPNFHVKLYEKSPVKRSFLNNVINKLLLKIEVLDDVYREIIVSDYIVCRAFKKLDKVIQVSREIAKKPHKLIVLKGQNAQEEINKAFKKEKYTYKLEKSMTNEYSKIILVDFI